MRNGKLVRMAPGAWRTPLSALAECLLLSSKDREQGMKAFFEKRKPDSEGNSCLSSNINRRVLSLCELKIREENNYGF
jgi:hypothetical protein